MAPLRLLLLVLAVLSGLAALPLAVLMAEAPVREVEGLAGLAMLLALGTFVLSAGACLWLLPVERFLRMRLAAAALWLSPLALFGGAGWSGAALLAGGGLAFAAWTGLGALTRRSADAPPR